MRVHVLRWRWMVHQSVCPCDGQSTQQKSNVNQRLPQQNLIAVIFGIDKRFQQVDGRDTNDGRAQFDLEHRGIDMAQPFRLVRVVFQIHS